MIDKNNEATKDEVAEASSASTPVNPGRRRFNAAGIAASGVLMTVASRSALATGACAAAGPSGVGSVHTSASPANSTPLTCGLSPGYWMTHDQSYWPQGMIDASFSSKVGSGPTDSFLLVVSATGNANNSQLYRHVAAEWLSMLQYPAIQKYLTFDQLKQMAAGTFYSGGQLWTSTQTIAYLTQIQS